MTLNRSPILESMSSSSPRPHHTCDDAPSQTAVDGTSSANMKILLIDDHPLWRQGVSSVLQRQRWPKPVEVLLASSGRHALTLLAQHPDIAVALLDLTMPEMDGLTTLSSIRQAAPNVRVLMLSASETADDVRCCIAAGAMGYLHKSSDETELMAALSLVMAGCVYVPPLMLTALAPPVRTAAVPQPDTRRAAQDTLPLTPRQREVLRLLCEGATNRDISQSLGLSEKTTKAHVGAIFRALGVVNRTQAALRAKALLTPLGPAASP